MAGQDTLVTNKHIFLACLSWKEDCPPLLESLERTLILIRFHTCKQCSEKLWHQCGRDAHSIHIKQHQATTGPNCCRRYGNLKPGPTNNLWAALHLFIIAEQQRSTRHRLASFRHGFLYRCLTAYCQAYCTPTMTLWMKLTNVGRILKTWMSSFRYE